jgi:hypothetical protein
MLKRSSINRPINSTRIAVWTGSFGFLAAFRFPPVYREINNSWQATDTSTAIPGHAPPDPEGAKKRWQWPRDLPGAGRKLEIILSPHHLVRLSVST